MSDHMAPLQLTDAQKFEIERFSRAIDGTTDLDTLRGIARKLLDAWMSQRAATRWVMDQQLGSVRSLAMKEGGQCPPSS
jgi:hypothetical protein